MSGANSKKGPSPSLNGYRDDDDGISSISSHKGSCNDGTHTNEDGVSYVREAGSGRGRGVAPPFVPCDASSVESGCIGRTLRGGGSRSSNTATRRQERHDLELSQHRRRRAAAATKPSTTDGNHTNGGKGSYHGFGLGGSGHNSTASSRRRDGRDDDDGDDRNDHDLTPRRGAEERRRRTRRGGKDEAPSSSKSRSAGRDSVVWSVLIFGLLFSFFDVLYIGRHLESSSSSTSSSSYPDIASPFPESGLDYGSSAGHAAPPPLISTSTDLTLKAAASFNRNSITNGGNENASSSHDKEPILRLIRDAGISVDPVEDADLIADLPTWSEVTAMYGEKPVLYGLKEGNCQRFQAHSDPGDHLVGTAGTFNTGTNLLAELLVANCHMAERQKKYGYKQLGVRWQVPWGKHTPAGTKEFRQNHKAAKDKDVDPNEIMPMVMIRDPLVWLKSMCRHHYTARWYRPDMDHCPDFTVRPLRTAVKYAVVSRQHTSILHMWNDYYNEYLQAEADLPFLMVRFEDLVFHPEETTRQVCECAGGSMRPNGRFKYIVDSAKKGDEAHGTDRTGYVDAIVRYGTEARRYDGYTSAADLTYIRDHVDPKLMEMMHYPSVDPTKVRLG